MITNTNIYQTHIFDMTSSTNTHLKLNIPPHTTQILTLYKLLIVI